jgi:hypothetical protein
MPAAVTSRTGASTAQPPSSIGANGVPISAGEPQIAAGAGGRGRGGRSASAGPAETATARTSKTQGKRMPVLYAGQADRQ